MKRQRKKISFYSGDLQEDSKFSIGCRDMSSPHHWKEVDGKYFSQKHKRILILPGSGANSAKEANGMCKVVEKILENSSVKYNIYSLYYPNSRIYNDITIVRAQKLFDEYLVNLISSKDKQGDLHRLDFEDAMSNMRDTLIFTHCYGCFIQRALEQEFVKTMSSIGYSAEEQNKILKQMVVIQHNSINSSIGCENPKTTQILRCSQQDEENSACDFYNDTFQYFIKNEELLPDEVLYMATSQNERVLLVPKICRGNDHNGGYWNDKKTEAGYIEEQIFKIIFAEIITSSEPIINVEQFIKKAIYFNTDNRELFKQLIENGREYFEEFQANRKAIRLGYDLSRQKILNEEFQPDDIEKIPVDILFAINDKEETLLDIALERENTELAIAIFSRMHKYLPKNDTLLHKYSRNYNDFNQSIEDYIQLSIDAANPQLFIAFAQHSTKLAKLNYDNIDNNILPIVIDIYLKQPKKEALCDQMQYFDKLMLLYSKCEKTSQTSNIRKARRQIESLAFSQDDAISRRYIQTSAQKYSANEFLAKAKQKWQNKKEESLTNIKDINNYAR